MNRASHPPLFVIENFAPSVGGVETFNREVLGTLAARMIASKNDGGTLLVGPKSRAWIRAEAPEIARAFEIPEIPEGRDALLQATLERIAVAPPRVIAVMRASKRLRSIFQKARRAGVPVVVYVHGRTSTFDRWPPRFWWRQRTQLHRAARVATNSDWMARNLETVGHARSGIDVIPLGIDTERFAPDPVLRAAERNASALGTAPLLVTVSRLVGAKGHQRVIEALPTLLETFPDLRWWIVGDGPSRGEIEAAIANAGVAHAVTLRGSLPDPRGPLAAADLFVLLAENEAFGLAALEAEAMGVPAIVLAGSGPEEIVRSGKEGETGAVLPVDRDAIARGLIEWIGDPERRRRAGIAARRLALDYTWEQTTDRFLALLEAVSRERDRSRAT